MTRRRSVLECVLGLKLAALIGPPAMAQESVKIGIILPMTGPFASIGKQVDLGAKLFLTQNGNVCGGRISRRFRHAQLDKIVSSHAAATAMAENYTGLPFFAASV